MSGTSWTEDEDAVIKANAKDLSASQVAKMLSGRSRNSVIGRAHRMGLSFAKSPGLVQMLARRPKPPRVPRAVTNKASGFVRRVAEPPRLKAEPIPAEPPNEQPTASILSVRIGQCKWPLGDPQHPDFGLCGKSCTGTYCTAHSRMAYQPGKASPKELARALRRYV